MISSLYRVRRHMSFYLNIVHVKTLFSGGKTVLVFLIILIILKLMNVNGDLGSVSVFRSIRSVS